MRTILFFGGLSVAVFLLFQLSKYAFTDFTYLAFTDLFIILAAFLFIVLGFFLSRILRSSSQTWSNTVNNSNLSRQEHKVLCLMNEGLSNLEIAGKLFIAETTVKKHVSNILRKLKAKRRTEAIKIGRDLEII